TLAIDQNMFDAQTELYGYFKKINSSEMAWGISAFLIAVVYFASFLFRNQKFISVIASGLGGLFFILVGSAYMITYPNIGSGIFTIIGIVCFMNVGQIVIPQKDITKEIEEHENANADK